MGRSLDGATFLRFEACAITANDYPVFHGVVGPRSVVDDTSPVGVWHPHDERWVAAYLQKARDIIVLRAVDLYKHYFSFVGLCEVLNELVPIGLELLAPVAILHVQVGHDDLVYICFSEHLLEAIK